MKALNLAFIFPGQGAQYVGMGADFIKNFSLAKQTFEEADELLGRSLSKIVLEGSENTLKETKNSQLGIFIVSLAIFRVVQAEYGLVPKLCAGLSLGEYTALTAGNWLPFSDALLLVNKRAELMNIACERHPGKMAVVMGLEAEVLESALANLKLSQDLWIANYNCPGQIVLSGTSRGIEMGSVEAKAKGAKRVLELQVHGAFHSGLMQSAEEGLKPYLKSVQFSNGTPILMNVSSNQITTTEHLPDHLAQQITHSVRWQQSMENAKKSGCDLFIEFGPGKTLAGLNKRMGLDTISIEKPEDLIYLSTIQ